VTSWSEVLLNVEAYMERYRKALDEIASNDWCNSQESLDKIQEIAQVALDGEPTTADHVNVGDDIEYKYERKNNG
jgi:hypothetical protein